MRAVCEFDAVRKPVIGLIGLMVGFLTQPLRFADPVAATGLAEDPATCVITGKRGWPARNDRARRRRRSKPPGAPA